MCDDLEQKPDCDFACFNIETIKDVSKEEVLFKNKIKKLEDNDPEILTCQAQVATWRRRLHVREGARLINFKNEATVRYVYGDSIVDMIIDSFGFKLEIEKTVGIEESQVDVTSGSKTDYCCW